VTATDLHPAEALGDVPALLEKEGVHLVLGGHRDEDFAAADLVVVSPGVPLSLPALQRAREHNVPIVTEIDLAPSELGARTVAVTGSNGKSTTTALVAAMLGADTGREAVPAGNFGTPLIEAARDDHENRWYALELSSFQLESLQVLRAAAAVLLNVRPDHLDRHGSFDDYRAAKAKIALHRARGAVLVYDADDEVASAIAAEADAPTWPVSVTRELRRGAYVSGEHLVLDTGDGPQTLMPAAEVPLPGRHNLANVLAAAAACRSCGVSADAIGRAVAGFEGLPHRLQQVASRAGVRFVDDSKATNVDSAIAAIRSFPGGHLYVLLGGRDKAGRFEPLAHALETRGATAITFGEAGSRIAEVLAPGLTGALVRCSTMADAIDRAAEMAAAGDTVLLAPACASFDAFANYGARGEAFALHARSLPPERIGCRSAGP